jgi:hypothetical protein
MGRRPILGADVSVEHDAFHRLWLLDKNRHPRRKGMVDGYVVLERADTHVDFDVDGTWASPARFGIATRWVVRQVRCRYATSKCDQRD